MTDDTRLHTAAVVVTHNRLSLLRECLLCLRNQTRIPDAIIVVNNGSTDGTAEWLSEQRDIIVITQQNTGSSGGQHSGIGEACRRGYDWIWCMDDDCMPQASALEELHCIVRRYNASPIGFLSSRVLWTDGSDHVMNLPGFFFNRNRWNFIGWDRYKEPACRIDAASFVSCLFSREAVESVGLPECGYFIWYDDLEYTVRFRGFCNFFVPSSIVLHATKRNGGTGIGAFNAEAGIHQYYGLRNFCHFYRKWNKRLLAGFFLSLLRRMLWEMLRGTFSYRAFRMNIRAVYCGLTGDMTFPVRQL
ncbi:MAG: glycosyltransferase [Acidobacteriota bacterium]